MVFLAAVLFCAVRFRRAGGGDRPVLSPRPLIFFIPPVYTFTIAEPHELLAPAGFPRRRRADGIAYRAHPRPARGRRPNAAAHDNRSLRFFTQDPPAQPAYDVTGCGRYIYTGFGPASRAACERTRMVRARQPGRRTCNSTPPSRGAALAHSRRASRRMVDRNLATRTLPVPSPADSARNGRGVCSFEPPDTAAALSADDERALVGSARSATIALDRFLLLARRPPKAASFLREETKVRDALLASLSHDLRTPLTPPSPAHCSACRGSRQRPGGGATPTPSRRRRASLTQPARHVAHRAGSLKARRDWVDGGRRQERYRALPQRPFRTPPSASATARRPYRSPCGGAPLGTGSCSACSITRKYGGDGETATCTRREGGDLMLSVTTKVRAWPADLDRI